MRTRHIAALAAILVGSATAQAQPLRVEYTVAGSSGNWLLNFTLFNDFGGPSDMGVYWFGINTPSTSVTGSAPAWWSNGASTANAGSGTTYQNSWRTDMSTFLLPGQSMGGFVAQSFALSAPTSVGWFAYAFSDSYAQSNGGYDVGDNFNGYTYNPGFESRSSGVILPPPPPPPSLLPPLPPPPTEGLVPQTTTPEPSTYALMASGLAALGYLKRRRKVA